MIIITEKNTQIRFRLYQSQDLSVWKCSLLSMYVWSECLYLVIVGNLGDFLGNDDSVSQELHIQRSSASYKHLKGSHLMSERRGIVSIKVSDRNSLHSNDTYFICCT